MTHTVVAELVAAVLTVEVEVGQQVAPTDSVVILESMKMEIPVLAEVAGSVVEVVVADGDVVNDGDPLVVIEPALRDCASLQPKPLWPGSSPQFWGVLFTL